VERNPGNGWCHAEIYSRGFAPPLSPSLCLLALPPGKQGAPESYAVRTPRTRLHLRPACSARDARQVRAAAEALAHEKSEAQEAAAPATSALVSAGRRRRAAQLSPSSCPFRLSISQSSTGLSDLARRWPLRTSRGGNAEARRGARDRGGSAAESRADDAHCRHSRRREEARSPFFLFQSLARRVTTRDVAAAEQTAELRAF